jgi:hypothetical protein
MVVPKLCAEGFFLLPYLFQLVLEANIRSIIEYLDVITFRSKGAVCNRPVSPKFPFQTISILPMMDAACCCQNEQLQSCTLARGSVGFFASNLNKNCLTSPGFM